jgi:hypothetical protein
MYAEFSKKNRQDWIRLDLDAVNAIGEAYWPTSWSNPTKEMLAKLQKDAHHGITLG